MVSLKAVWNWEIDWQKAAKPVKAAVCVNLAPSRFASKSTQSSTVKLIDKRHRTAKTFVAAVL
jgi:hypothetical protein